MLIKHRVVGSRCCALWALASEPRRSGFGHKFPGNLLALGGDRLVSGSRARRPQTQPSLRGLLVFSPRQLPRGEWTAEVLGSMASVACAGIWDVSQDACGESTRVRSHQASHEQIAVGSGCPSRGYRGYASQPSIGSERRLISHRGSADYVLLPPLIGHICQASQLFDGVLFFGPIIRVCQDPTAQSPLWAYCRQPIVSRRETPRRQG